tara:strand:+ start:4196 stop:5143 length:948 start_codon:yes stop_codon:yes gene_type:complete
MLMPNRYTGNSKYRYSFNGMEKDNEVAGDGNSFTTQFRQYDPRIARWTSIDPVTHHHFSPYNSFDNNPILIADPSGADGEEKGGVPDKPNEHKIKKGETLGGIAKQYKVSVNDLAKWNNISDKKKTIYAGKKIITSDPTKYNDFKENQSNLKVKLLKEGYNFKSSSINGLAVITEISAPSNADADLLVGMEMMVDPLGLIRGTKESLDKFKENGLTVSTTLQAVSFLILRKKVKMKMSPTKLKVGDVIDIEKSFTIPGNKGALKHPKGYYISPERGGGRGHGGHRTSGGGSAWKLHNKQGKRIYTLDSTGKIIGD